MLRYTELGYRPKADMDGYVPLAVILTAGEGPDAAVVYACVRETRIEVDDINLMPNFRAWTVHVQDSARVALDAAKRRSWDDFHAVLRRTHGYRIRASAPIDLPETREEPLALVSALFGQRIAPHPHFRGQAGEPFIVQLQ